MNWLDGATARAQRILNESVARGDVPGAVVLIALGADASVVTAGHPALGAAAPITRDAIFRIASITKPITALAALMLVDDGILTLDEPVERFLPELSVRRVLRHIDGPLSDTQPAHRAITLEDLLTLRLGFGLPPAYPAPTPIIKALQTLGLMAAGPTPPPFDPDTWLQRLCQLPLMAQPVSAGSTTRARLSWAYSSLALRACRFRWQSGHADV